MKSTTKFAGFLILAIFVMLAAPGASRAQVAVGVSIHIGPPALPVYAQPICPGPGYIWTPGYWAYGPAGYYWVPGTWVLAPQPGYLWTPGYWGWVGGGYIWHAGYWGPHVGFYGGINYGYGYFGTGFVGGEWRGSVFHYNTAVSHVNTTIIHNTYVNNTVINRNVVVNHVSYNGGTGGVVARPTVSEQAAYRERHMQATSLQTQHEQMARNDHNMLASYNHGRPTIAATERPGTFKTGAGSARDPHMNYEHVNPNTNVHAYGDRPPNAHTNQAYSRSADSPQQSVHPETAHANTYNANANHPKTETRNYSQGQTHNNTEHPNSYHPGSSPHENHPQQHEAHPGGEHQRAAGHGR